MPGEMEHCVAERDGGAVVGGAEDADCLGAEGVAVLCLAGYFVY